jgi:hypothetical protein
METGEWKSNGVWIKKDKQAQAVPSNLQVIPADDLVKVRQQERHCTAQPQGCHPTLIGCHDSLSGPAN